MVEEVITTATAEKPDYFQIVRDAVRGVFGIPSIPQKIIEQYRKAGQNVDTAYLEAKDIIKGLKQHGLYDRKKQYIPDELRDALKAYYKARAEYNQAAKLFGPDGRLAQRTKFKNLKWWA